jgi:hypothetical protein
MPRCKNCKELFKVVRFNSKFCDAIDCKAVEALQNLDKLKQKEVKDWNKRKREKIEKYGLSKSKPPKNILQDEINKLARLIDNKFKLPCISCGTTNDVQYAGGHRISVGACTSIRYNLHNIRKQCNKNCNKEKSGNPDGYDEGLIKRHSKEYKDYVKYELRKIYSYVDLGSLDYTEKIKLVRKLIRDFDTFDLKDSIQARHLFNKIIDIYK